ncbi:NAD(P)-dependent oxidoreductase [Arthrobacter psychrolactophilus]|uniref:NAD(P)-dependent oxidoreductase n=1 Tax=Arthrobacter psychrolactophilus TaxID=92442 RepID=A0A2V5J8F5_9MICC|nr:SDR family oxidoreductase [Arthrobacter psychrolactophilus]PYI39300.1 NAD(P)-dependent oxidoreductase [Arthrobacter psychrolactophilus]
MTLPRIAVTGATGFIGGHTAQTLADAGLPQRLIVRNPERAPHLPLAEVAVAAFGDRSGVEHALKGIDTVLMVSAAESATRREEHMAFIDGAAAAGVRHIVYTSFVAAAPDAVFTLAHDHFATEEHLRSSGMAWTILRDNFYLDFMPMMVGDDGVIRGPAGNGRAALVSRRDVAAAAAAILQDPATHAGRTYELTGPEALTMTDIAATLSAGLQRSISFHNETVAEAYESRKAWDAPQWQYDAWVSTYTAIGSGAMEQLSTSVEELTCRRPQSLAEFLAA